VGDDEEHEDDERDETAFPDQIAMDEQGWQHTI
jgi:hypothetical protein